MQSQVDRTNTNIVDNRLFKLFLFIITFALAPLPFLPLYPLILIFPSGLFAFFYENVNRIPQESTLLGWLIYIGISEIAILTAKRSLFISLYVIFLLLLLINVAGCNRIIENGSFGF